MKLVPIPTTLEALRRSSQHWLPFLEAISHRSKESFDDLLDMVIREEVQPALVWDEDSKQARALVGIRTCRCGDDLIGEIVWLTGRGMKDWLHLLPQLEEYLRHLGCVTIKPICRPGWARMIKGHGYKITHYVMEKKL